MGVHPLITVKMLKFWLFSLLVLEEKRQLGFPCSVATETATFERTGPSQCSKAKNYKKSDLMLAWPKSLRSLAKLTG